MKMATSKPYTPSAGMVKALELADLLDAAQIESSDAAAMAEAEWKLLAAAARTTKPTSATRAMVLAFLMQREAVRAALAEPRNAVRK